MTDRLEALRAMVAKAPNNALARFGLANELLKAGALREGADHLAQYLAQHDDEGAGWLRYAETLHTLGDEAGARQAVAKGMDAAQRHAHATLTGEFEAKLEEWDG